MTAVSPGLFCTIALIIAKIPFIIKVYSAESEAADCHSIADEFEGFRRYQLRIREIADRQMLSTEIQVLCTAVQGISGGMDAFNPDMFEIYN